MALTLNTLLDKPGERGEQGTGQAPSADVFRDQGPFRYARRAPSQEDERDDFLEVPPSSVLPIP